MQADQVEPMTSGLHSPSRVLECAELREPKHALSGECNACSPPKTGCGVRTRSKKRMQPSVIARTSTRRTRSRKSPEPQPPAPHVDEQCSSPDLRESAGRDTVDASEEQAAQAGVRITRSRTTTLPALDATVSRTSQRKTSKKGKKAKEKVCGDLPGEEKTDSETQAAEPPCGTAQRRSSRMKERAKKKEGRSGAQANTEVAKAQLIEQPVQEPTAAQAEEPLIAIAENHRFRNFPTCTVSAAKAGVVQQTCGATLGQHCSPLSSVQVSLRPHQYEERLQIRMHNDHSGSVAIIVPLCGDQ